MKQEVKNCTLEWDKIRGELYVNDGNTGGTILRVCGLDRNQVTDLAPGCHMDISIVHEGGEHTSGIVWVCYPKKGVF